MKSEQAHKQTFDGIVDRYSGQLYGYLKKRLHSGDDVEDILQSVFFSFWAKMPFINPQKYPAYLFRTAHNKAINYMKKNSRYVEYETLKHQKISEPDFEDRKEKQRQQIIAAFQKLKPKEALAIELQYYQNMSYKQIAGIMETTPDAVDSLLFRAKKKLRHILQDSRQNHVLVNGETKNEIY